MVEAGTGAVRQAGELRDALDDLVRPTDELIIGEIMNHRVTTWPDFPRSGEKPARKRSRGTAQKTGYA